MTATKRSFAVLACAVTVVLCFAPASSAQVPALPPVPPPVADAVKQVSGVTNPVLLQGAQAAQPIVNAIGFGLRPLCVRGSTIALALGLAGLPVDPRVATVPLTAFCRGSLESGPADPVFAQVDDAVGPTLREGAEPVLQQVNSAAVEPIREDIALACIGVALVGPTSLPPPISRFDPAYELCYR
jgi:hypothetical protein